MAESISIKVKGVAEFRRKFQQAPQIMQDEVNEALERSARAIRASAVRFAPGDTGMLRQSIEIDVRPLEASVFTNLKYAPAMEFGVERNTVFPDWREGRSLEVWSRRHGIPAFLVARKIWRKGITARKFMQRAREKEASSVQSFFDAALSNIERRMREK